MSDDVNPYQATAAVARSGSPVREPPTTADFMLELDDLVAFNSHSPFTRAQIRRVRISLVVILGSLLFLTFQFARSEVLLPICIGFVAALLACSPPMVRRRARKQYAKIYQHRLPRSQSVVLSKEGFFVRTPDSESCHFWRGVERIDATATHAFFYLLTIQAIIVPSRAFASEAHFRAFLDCARGLWKESREPRAMVHHASDDRRDNRLPPFPNDV